MAVGLTRVLRVSVVVVSLFYSVFLVLNRPLHPVKKHVESTRALLNAHSNYNVNYMPGKKEPLSVDVKSGGGVRVVEDPKGFGQIEDRKFDKPRLIPCNNINPVSSLRQRGSFWVLHNYITATLRFACDESITYTTHADHTFLDNLVPLVERWLGPISLSVYTPGTDYYETILRIHYLRECTPLVRDFVSFHLFFDNNQIPKNLSSSAEKAFDQMPPVNCLIKPGFGLNITTFRKRRSLFYPINVGRNVAREMASTHYVLASDIELYPSPNLIPNFLEMIRRDGSELLKHTNPKVLVLPLFEVEANVSSLPNDKVELQDMLNKTIAQPFREKICPLCFNIPKQEEWLRAEVTQGMHVFTVGKRQGPHYYWEPLYIGTKYDPMYDERLSWDGWEDKMVQAYILCLLDYEFHIIDNAFLLHRPGIKKKKYIESVKMATIKKQRKMIRDIVEPELTSLYGRRPVCLIQREWV